MRKRCTILVALYKAGDFLCYKIANLRKLSNFREVEIVLLNCQNLHRESSMFTGFALNNRNVTVLSYSQHVSLYRSWNDGIRASDSDYIMNSNVDDMIHPDYVLKCIDYLDAHPDCAVVSSQVRITNRPNQLYPNWHYDSNMEIGFPAHTAGPCPMWRRSLHEKYGFFDDSYQIVADAVMWEKWQFGGEKFDVINEPLVLYLRNPYSLERRKDEFDNLLILEEIMRSQACPQP